MATDMGSRVGVKLKELKELEELKKLEELEKLENNPRKSAVKK